MKLLEIGSVKTVPVHPNAVTVDSIPGADHQVQWGDEPLPFPEESFDEVYTSHTLEHLPWFKTLPALREAERVLKLGGFIEVWVPDFGYLIESYLAGRCGDEWFKYNPDRDPMVWLNGRIFTYGPGEENWHRAVFDEAFLARCLLQAGFIHPKRIPRRTRGTSHGVIDLGMSAQKASGN